MKIKNSPSQIKALKDALVVLDAKSAYADFVISSVMLTRKMKTPMQHLMRHIRTK